MSRPMEFHFELLKARRQEKNMTREELEDLTGICVRNIYKIETGQTHDPGFRTIYSLCSALDLKTDDLVTVLDDAEQGAAFV